MMYAFSVSQCDRTPNVFYSEIFVPLLPFHQQSQSQWSETDLSRIRIGILKKWWPPKSWDHGDPSIPNNFRETKVRASQKTCRVSFFMSMSSSVSFVFSYFTDHKKGEVNELRAVSANWYWDFFSIIIHFRCPFSIFLFEKQLLKTVNVERDPKRKRDIIKKVIAYMTLGIDVSSLFNDMVLCVESRDLVVKKMVYLYLITYAQQHPEMALMCTNTLHRDFNDQDPMVRGLALRSLCSLRIPTMIEYISEPLKKSLTDANAYVRKTGGVFLLVCSIFL
jgi:hypothetical protein